MKSAKNYTTKTQSVFAGRQFYFIKRAAMILYSLARYGLFRLKGTLFRPNPSRQEIVNFAFQCPLIRPFQVKEEISRLLAILEKSRPKVILEIGTERGGTLFLLAQTLPKEVVIISLDLPGGRFGGGYPLWRIPLYQSFAQKKQKIHLVRSDSHQKETLKKTKRILKGRKIDWLFVDGDHTYRGVKKDFEMYGPLVKKGGMIAFHDIVPPPPGTGSEVSKFWQEIRSKYKHTEIVEDWHQGWAGIGLIKKG